MVEIGSGVTAGHRLKDKGCFITLLFRMMPSLNNLTDINKCVTENSRLVSCRTPRSLNLKMLPQRAP